MSHSLSLFLCLSLSLSHTDLLSSVTEVPAEEVEMAGNGEEDHETLRKLLARGEGFFDRDALEPLLQLANGGEVFFWGRVFY